MLEILCHHLEERHTEKMIVGGSFRRPGEGFPGTMGDRGIWDYAPEMTEFSQGG